ncbi:2-amino-4-hydroxy-6-hydroxymethyldihydropteridine diphosphokinase, partial [Staphylococcus aureus]|uniref:2-amino-4-hydroxy-6- hydroxymethyldihydropteridine diphosphokinase n=1 Tax=Staphylococcus aureus TaxID=1280 RepID=UPI00272EB3D5
PPYLTLDFSDVTSLLATITFGPVAGIIVALVKNLLNYLFSMGDPVGYTEQPNFLNLCVEIQTTLTVLQLLECCLKTEECLHRIRKERWGPRTLDVDILLYAEEMIDLPNLSVPHPRMNERAFVLIPLNDI